MAGQFILSEKIGIDLGLHFAAYVLPVVMLVPIIPSLVLAILPIKAEPWMYGVPLLGQSLGIMRLLRGDGVTTEQLGLCLVGSLLAAFIAVAVTARLYRSARLAISAGGVNACAHRQRRVFSPAAGPVPSR